MADYAHREVSDRHDAMQPATPSAILAALVNTLRLELFAKINASCVREESFRFRVPYIVQNARLGSMDPRLK